MAMIFQYQYRLLLKANTNLRCHVCSKQYSSKKFSSSLNLPKTKFQLTMKDCANREKVIQKVGCGFKYDNYKFYSSEHNCLLI